MLFEAFSGSDSKMKRRKDDKKSSGRTVMVAIAACLLAILVAVAAANHEMSMDKTIMLHSSHPDFQGGRWRLAWDAAVSAPSSVAWLVEAIREKWTLPAHSTVEGIEFFDPSQEKYVELSDHLVGALMTSKRPAHILVRLASTVQTPPVMIEGRAFDLTSSDLYICGCTLRIAERDGADLGTGLVSWDGSIVLAKYLELHPELVQGKSVLELGAGTGVSGIAAMLLGASTVLLTDLPYALPNLRANIDANVRLHPHRMRADAVSAEVLDWFDCASYPTTPWDVVLGADVVWLEELVPALVSTIVHLARKGSQVLLSHQTRSLRTDELLFSSLRSNGLSIRQIPRQELHAEYSIEKISVFHISCEALQNVLLPTR